jgi:pilus assembly protein Flp/PilA
MKGPELLFATIFGLLQSVRSDKKGVAALEYGIMAGLIAGVIILAVTAIGGSLNGVFTAINLALAGVPGA